MLGFLIFVAGSVSTHVAAQYDKLDEQSKKELSDEVAELKQVTDETLAKGKALLRKTFGGIFNDKER